MNPSPYKQFSGEEIIADILLEVPESQEVFAAHNIACAGCHVNQYESLKDGVMAHYGEDAFWEIIKDLNEMCQELKIPANQELKKKDPIVTDAAKKQVLAFQAEQKKEGFGLRIEVHQNGEDLSHFLDFEDQPQKRDIVIQTNDIRIFCDPESLRLLKNKQVNYVVEGDEEGFKFEPQPT